MAPPRVRRPTLIHITNRQHQVILILHEVNVDSLYGRQVTPVPYNLCGTHLRPRGSLAGVNKAYVLFQAAHLGSLISFGVRRK